MKTENALEFCAKWLPLWSGNRPEELSLIYSEKAFYRDPAKPEGVVGRENLLKYFTKLLASFPDWKWTAMEVFEIENGFALKWNAEIPLGANVVRETGLDIVIVENGLIVSNEVFFDRAALLAEMNKMR